jgi:hypothetical protein
MYNVDEVLALKRMVLDLNRMLHWKWQNGRYLSDDEGGSALEQAMDRVRDAVERVTECRGIPLEWYKWNDEVFVGQIAASLNKKK